MTNNIKIISGVLLGLVLIIGVYVFGVSNRSENKSFGSVVIGSEYHSTTTKNFNGTVAVAYSMLQSTPGTLGSIVIGGATAGQQLNLYDATSTVTNLAIATTTLVTIPTTALGGTYTYDLVFTKGLLLEVIGATGTSTITFR